MLESLCKLSGRQMIHMKCQALFSLKNNLKMLDFELEIPGSACKNMCENMQIQLLLCIHRV